MSGVSGIGCSVPVWRYLAARYTPLSRAEKRTRERGVFHSSQFLAIRSWFLRDFVVLFLVHRNGTHRPAVGIPAEVLIQNS